MLAFCLSPKQKFRQNFKPRTRAINAHSVYMLVMCVLTPHEYISRRGNVVSLRFIWLRRLAMPLFYGRRHRSHVFFYIFPCSGDIGDYRKCVKLCLKYLLIKTIVL